MHVRQFAATLALALLACKADSAADLSLTVRAAHVPAGALKQLPWLLGTFRGWEVDVDPRNVFFERNVLANDSTLLVLSFHDSTLTEADTTRYELRGDSLTNVGAGRYIATAVSADSLTFGPLSGVDNFFTWRKDTDSSWYAFIFPFGRPSIRPRSYRMERVNR